MRIQPYLHFNGQCEEAFRLYERVLGGKIQGFFRYGQSPMADSAPAEWSEKIMHVGMALGSDMLLGSDAPPQYFDKPRGFRINIELDEEAEADRVYNALSQGGHIEMAPAETFWSKRFAMFTDRFGTPWMINVSKPMELGPDSRTGE